MKNRLSHLISESSLNFDLVLQLMNRNPEVAHENIRTQIQALVENLCEKQYLGEIKWRSPEVVNNALDAPISCGFEAEAYWQGISEGLPASELAELTYYDNEVQDIVRENGVEERIQNDFMDWQATSPLYEQFREEAVEEIIMGLRADEEDELFDGLMKDIGEEDFQELEPQLDEFRQKLIKMHQNDIKTIQGRIRDLRASDVDEYDLENMERNIQYIQAEIEDIGDLDYKQLFAIYAKDGDLPDNSEDLGRQDREYWTDVWRGWLDYQIRNQDKFSDEVEEIARERLQDEVNIDDWIGEEYNGSLIAMLADYGVYIDEITGLESVADLMTDWIKPNSKYDHVEFGSHQDSELHTSQDYWKVEDDPSLKDCREPNMGAEIISPVYDSPREMLSEMSSLFEWMSNNGVYTNECTGLHITMSMRGGEQRPNRVKMAVMLDDPHLLEIFDRGPGTYGYRFTESQLKSMISAAKSLKAGDSQSLEQLEDILRDAVSSGKFSSIHFKDAVNSDGNQLIEFRIAGNANYLNSLDKVEDLAVRYATIMRLGHDPLAYRREYATKLLRLVSKAEGFDFDMEIPEGAMGVQQLINAIQELGITDGRRLAIIQELLEWMITHGSDNEYKLKSIFRELAHAVYFGDTKNSSKRTARMFRVALNTMLGDNSITKIFQLVLDETNSRSRTYMANGLAELLATPRIFDKLGLNRVEYKIIIPRDKTLLIKGSALRDIYQGNLPDDFQDQFILLNANIRYELQQAGLIRDAASSDSPDMERFKQAQALERIRDRMKRFQTQIGGARIDINTEIDTTIVRPVVSWMNDPEKIDPNTYYIFADSNFVDKPSNWGPWNRKMLETGIEIRLL